MKKVLLVVTTQDSVYMYFMGIDGETHEVVCREECLLCEADVTDESLAEKYGYEQFKEFEL